MHGPARHGRLVAVEVDSRLPKRQHRARGRSRLAPPQHRFDSGHKFADAHRLGDVVVGAQLQAQDFVHLLAPRREHDDGRGRPLGAQPTAHFVPIHRGQHHIEQNQVWPPSQGPLQSRRAIGDRLGLIAFKDQVVEQDPGNGRLVLDD